MMKSRFVAAGFASILAALGVAACGGSTSAPSLSTACADYSKALCQKLASCDPFSLKLEYPDEGACETTFRSECNVAVNLKGVNFTPTFLEACGGAMNALSCDDYNYGRTPSACAIPSGSLADSAACASAIQCKGLVCTGATSTACGTCAERPAGSCIADTDCPGAQVCSYAFGGTTGAGTCTTLPGVGATCDANTHCARSLYCPAPPGGGTATCTALPTEGQPCTTACATSLFCVAGKCSAPQFATVGSPCNDGSSVNFNAPSVYCNASSCLNGTCVAFGGEGAACGGATDPGCSAGLNCVNSKCTSQVEPVCN